MLVLVLLPVLVLLALLLLLELMSVLVLVLVLAWLLLVLVLVLVVVLLLLEQLVVVLVVLQVSLPDASGYSNKWSACLHQHPVSVFLTSNTISNSHNVIQDSQIQTRLIRKVNSQLQSNTNVVFHPPDFPIQRHPLLPKRIGRRLVLEGVNPQLLPQPPPAFYRCF